MNDPLFLDAHLAEIFDYHSTFDRPEFTFIMPLVMTAASVLDVGCGTGMMLRRSREAGHAGRLCGVEPAEQMLQDARRSTDIEWVLGDATTGGWNREFDLVVMSGYVIQVIMKEDEVRATFSAVRKGLTDDGRFIFASRNPLVRDWETWMPNQVLEFRDGAGTLIRKWHEITKVEGDCVYYTTTFASERWEQPVTVGGRQRFWSRAEVSGFLADAGLAIKEQFGDWDQLALD